MSKVAAVVLGVVALTTVPSASAQQDQPLPPATATVMVEYVPEDEAVERPLVDELAPATVLTVRAVGFEADRTGTVRQCVDGPQRVCRNRLSVRFDDDGAATFQYLVTDAFGGVDAAGCTLTGPRCTVELTVGDRTTTIDTVFGEKAPPPGRMTVTPRRGLRVGDQVTVQLSGFPPETGLVLMVCAHPATSGSRCGAPGPELALTTGADGVAVVDLTLDAAEVGSDRVACGRRVTCRLVVTSDQRAVRAAPVVLSFAAAAGADYDAPRLFVGLLSAVALLALAGWLVRSTDWRPPGEADASPIEEAELADLDREAAEFEEADSTQELGV